MPAAWELALYADWPVAAVPQGGSVGVPPAETYWLAVLHAEVALSGERAVSSRAVRPAAEFPASAASRTDGLEFSCSDSEA